MVSGNLVFGFLVGAFAVPAHAQEDETVSEAPDVIERERPPQPVITPVEPKPFDAGDLPIPTLEIDRIPAHTSYEFAMQVSFGPVAYFEHVSANSPGFGARAGWGRNLGPWHRVGAGGLVTVEGEPGVYTLFTFEPSITWDVVNKSGVALGVSVGPSFIHTRANATRVLKAGYAIDPVVAARVGWSQTFSSVGRRIFVYLEPKVRLTDRGPVTIAALVVGSGRGR